MADDRKLRLREGLVTRALNNETVILDLRASAYLTMNPVAAVIWRTLEVGATQAEIVSALVAEFEVSDEKASADVNAFLASCRERGFLTSSSSAG